MRSASATTTVAFFFLLPGEAVVASHMVMNSTPVTGQPPQTDFLDRIRSPEPEVPTRPVGWLGRWQPGPAGDESTPPSPPPEDTSPTDGWLRYASFVPGLALAMSAVLFVVPVAFMRTARACRDGCSSLEEDLRSSVNENVHPCDDFYTHVCSGWDGRANRQRPLDRNKAAFDRKVAIDILLKPIPRSSSSAKRKAVDLLLSCLRQREYRGKWSIPAILEDLGMPWPHASSGTRQQLMYTLVRASLHFGLPAFWAFYVGRHPVKSAENTIYMTLDKRVLVWTADMSTLKARGRQDNYIRRCAEVIGGKGQSYSSMIEDVLSTHATIVKLLGRFWDNYNPVPRLEFLRDPHLRRALNGHLPDESQLWPEDQIINLQPQFLEQLDSTHFREDGSRKRFKLFLGAYMVWMLSPMVSPYLTSALLEDTGKATQKGMHLVTMCSGSMEIMMPLVKYTLNIDALPDLKPAWNIMRLSVKSVTMLTRAYGKSAQKIAKDSTALLNANALNMSVSWPQLDKAYNYLPSDSHGYFFDLYLRSARATVAFLKQSMRRPRNNVVHLPGIASMRMYRLLVARDVNVRPSFVGPPLLQRRTPFAVLAATAGARASQEIASLLRFTLYYNGSFEKYQQADLEAGLQRLDADVQRFKQMVNASELLPNASDREMRQVYLASFGAYAASKLPAMLKKSQSTGGSSELEPTRQDLTPGAAEDQLFFKLFCFGECGKTGRTRLIKKSICNIALPAIPAFRGVFKCGPQHRLTTKFTWPEPPPDEGDVGA